MHLLLVLILLVGPAFLSSKNKVEEMPTIDFIPNKLIDAAFSGGGTPNTRPPPPAPLEPPAPREVAPPAPKSEPVKPPEAEPIKEVVKPPKPTTESFEVKKDNKKPKPEIVTTAVSRHTDSQKKQKQKSDAEAHAREVAEAKAQEAADSRRREMAAALLTSTSRGIRSDMAPTAISINPGPGGGGEAYANYAQVVKSIYEHAWLPSDDTTSDEAITKVTVTIKRDGSVAASRILKGSGDSSIDKSVQRTLDRVRYIAPFPEGAKDQERTFTINFNLKAKRLAG
jgi:TonB family protein